MKPPCFIYSVVDSTIDHLLVSANDCPGVGMGMLEGSGEVVPTAAVYRNDKCNGKSKTKRRLTCALGSVILICSVQSTADETRPECLQMHGHRHCIQQEWLSTTLSSI